MVSLRLGLAARALIGAAGTGALIASAACGRHAADSPLAGDTTVAGRAAAAVRLRYQANDVAAAGAWTWTAPNGVVYVLVDAQSVIDQLVQARIELWATSDSIVEAVGRSDVMSSVAEFGAYAFEDLTGDGVPDFFGYVADSAGVSFPVFIPGARGGMVEQLEDAARGWQFATEEPDLPQVLRGPVSACALQLWAREPAPDSQPEGWRYLSLRPGGELAPPRTQAPDCSPGLQPGPSVP